MATKRPSSSASARGRYVQSVSTSRPSSSESDEETDTDSNIDVKPSSLKLAEFREFQEFQRWKRNKLAAKAKGKGEDEETLIGNKLESETDRDSGRGSPPPKKRRGKGFRAQSPSGKAAAAGFSGAGGPSSTTLIAVGIGLLFLLLAVAVVYWWLNWGRGTSSSGSTTMSSTLLASMSSTSGSRSPSSFLSSGSKSGPMSSYPKSPSTSSAPSSKASSYTLPGISKNKIGIGFLPDCCSSPAQSMSDITSGLGIKSSFYGWYAQLNNKVPWDGSQLIAQMDDIKASGAIFQPAVMPTGGWAGLNASDPSQGTAIASVMKQFTDEGIEVWLRFAHEVNWYQTDGTYKGDADDFKAGWAVVAAAVKDNPLVKMFFTPNVANLAQYQEFFPDDPTTVDIIGIDYYPKSGFDFVSVMKPFHDAYCLNSSHKITFAIGETGPGYNGNVTQKLEWLDVITSEATKLALPKMLGVSWFNYNKGVDFYLYDTVGSSITTGTKAWMANGTVASGTVVP